MKKSIFYFLLFLLVSISFMSCKKDTVDDTVSCSDTVNRDMETFFNTLHNSPNYELYETMDLVTHEYTFTTNHTLQICGFGYKSQDPSLVYEIKLSNSNTVYYQGNLSFASSQFDYVDVPPITLPAGTYTLSRTLTGNNISLSQTIGPVTRGPNGTHPQLPVSTADFSITTTRFYGMGGPVLDYGIPNIYFEYIIP